VNVDDIWLKRSKSVRDFEPLSKEDPTCSSEFVIRLFRKLISVCHKQANFMSSFFEEFDLIYDHRVFTTWHLICIEAMDNGNSQLFSPRADVRALRQLNRRSP